MFQVRVDAPGELWIAPRPRGGEWVADEVSGLRRLGVMCVFCMMEAQELRDLELADLPESLDRQGIAWQHVPVTDRGVPTTPDFDHATAAAVAMVRSGGRVVAMCRMGIGRSGLFAARVLTLTGVSWREALTQVTLARGLAVPDTQEQRDWLRSVAAH